MNRLEDMLFRRGVEVDPEALVRAVERALDAARVPPYPEPREHLSPQEVHLLAEGGFVLDGPPLGAEDPVLKGALEYAVLCTTALTTRQAAERLGVNDSRIRQRLGSRELYGIKLGDHWRLPAFQFTHTGLVPHIELVMPHIDRGLSPLAVFHWFVTPNSDLSLPDSEALSPLQWLSSGHDPDAPAELARWL